MSRTCLLQISFLALHLAFVVRFLAGHGAPGQMFPSPSRVILLARRTHAHSACCSGPLYQNVVKCSAFDVEVIFHSPANKTHFHKKGCALDLILKVRVLGTRKWPIAYY